MIFYMCNDLLGPFIFRINEFCVIRSNKGMINAIWARDKYKNVRKSFDSTLTDNYLP